MSIEKSFVPGNSVIFCNRLYKAVNKQAPIYLTEMFARLSDVCKRELRNTKTDLAVPRLKSAFGEKCFSYKDAKLWNDLSVEAKTSKSYEMFKKRINNANTESRFSLSCSCYGRRIVQQRN